MLISFSTSTTRNLVKIALQGGSNLPGKKNKPGEIAPTFLKNVWESPTAHSNETPWDSFSPLATSLARKSFTEQMVMRHIKLRWIKKTCTLQGINISHLGKRKIIFKMPFLGDMLVSWRVIQIQQTELHCTDGEKKTPSLEQKPWELLQRPPRLA